MWGGQTTAMTASTPAKKTMTTAPHTCDDEAENDAARLVHDKNLDDRYSTPAEEDKLRR